MKSWLSALALLLLFAGSARAQEGKEDARKIIAEKIQLELTQTAGWALETKIVKGAPYSATAESETVQMLIDGNRIRSKTTTMMYRDGEGRTRREIFGATPGAPTQIFISDPIGGTSFSLDPRQHLAVKQGNALRWKIRDDDPKALTNEQKRQLELKLQAERAATQTSQGWKVPEKKTATTESLGQQTIEGVMCEGKRTTVTIPANAIGNELPINVVTEEWYSTELQVLVLTKHTDPRVGETTYRLTGINRGEPARALFEVPSDYTVQESYKTILDKKAKEE